MIFLAISLILVLLNFTDSSPVTLDKCLTYTTMTGPFIDYHRKYPNLKWDQELHHQACHELLKPGSAGDFYRYKLTAEKEYPTGTDVQKVRRALYHLEPKDVKAKLRNLSGWYGCNSLVDGSKVKVVCLYEPV